MSSASTGVTATAKKPRRAKQTDGAKAGAARVPALAAAIYEPRDDQHQSIRLWLRLFGSSNLIASELRSRLRAEFGSTLARFDLMAQLERAPDGLTMSDVSKRLMVTNAAVTGVTDGLVADGFVERVDHSADRRSSIVRLTEAGRAAFLAMARRHETWIVELFDGLDDDEKQQLKTLLGKLKSSLGARL